MATLLENLRAHLIAEGVAVRDPRTAAAGKHPLWLEPRDGAIAPGEVKNATENDANLVLSAYKLPGLSTGPYEGDTWRYDNAQIVFRAPRPPDVYALEEQIRAEIHDRRDYMLGTMRIIESLIFAELAPLGSGEQGFSFRVEYSFQRYIVNP